MTFNFGQPQKPEGGFGSFGQSQPTFGTLQPAQNAAGSTSGQPQPAFGSQQNTFGSSVQPQQAASMFGAQQNTGFGAGFGASLNQASSQPQNNLFGNNQNTSAPAGNIFGAPQSAATFGGQPNTPSSNLFAGQSTGQPAPSMFGAQPSSSSTQPAPSMFGAQSSLTTGQTAPSMFGSQPSSASTQPAPSMFGTQPSLTTGQPAPSMFGGQPSSASTQPAPSMFGTQPSLTTGQPAPSLFGGQPSLAPTAVPALFGGQQVTSQAAVPSTISSFGAPPTIAAAPGLFGAQTGMQNASFLSGVQPKAATTTPGLFSTLPSQATPLTFGAQPKATDAPSGLSGAQAGAKPSVSLFGSQSTTLGAAPIAVLPPSGGSNPLGAAASAFLGSVKPVDTFTVPKANSTLFSTPAAAGAVTSLFGPTLPKVDTPALALSDLSNKVATPSINASVLANVPSMLKNKTMEEILNRWSLDLDKSTTEFHKQSLLIQKHDMILLENGFKITELFNELQKSEGVSREIEMNLEYIEAQHSQIEQAVDGYENTIRGILRDNQQASHRYFFNVNNSGGGSQDEEREKSYILAEKMNISLDDMQNQLSSVVAQLNMSNISKSNGDQIDAITQILNEHLNSLEWLEKNAKEIGASLMDVEGISRHAWSSHQRQR